MCPFIGPSAWVGGYYVWNWTNGCPLLFGWYHWGPDKSLRKDSCVIMFDEYFHYLDNVDCSPRMVPFICEIQGMLSNHRSVTF